MSSWSASSSASSGSWSSGSTSSAVHIISSDNSGCLRGFHCRYKCCCRHSPSQTLEESAGNPLPHLFILISNIGRATCHCRPHSLAGRDQHNYGRHKMPVETLDRCEDPRGLQCSRFIFRDKLQVRLWYDLPRYGWHNLRTLWSTQASGPVSSASRVSRLGCDYREVRLA